MPPSLYHRSSISSTTPVHLFDVWRRLPLQEGRALFRKMAVALVSTLKNETRDPWELGAEAARIWAPYKQAAEDGCCE